MSSARSSGVCRVAAPKVALHDPLPLRLVVGFVVDRFEFLNGSCRLRRDLLVLRQLGFTPDARVGRIFGCRRRRWRHDRVGPITSLRSRRADRARRRFRTRRLSVAAGCAPSSAGLRNSAPSLPGSDDSQRPAPARRHGGSCITSPGVSRGRAVSCRETIRCPSQGLSR